MPDSIGHTPFQHRRLKVLIGAYACSPIRGSEQGVGWGWAEAISTYHDVWVLTGAQWKGEIEAELSRRPELRRRMRFFYIPRIRYRIAERLWPPMYLHTYRRQWQKDAYELAKRLHAEVNFDIVHQLTYVGFRVPGLLWKLDAPFVWGPVGGLEQTNWRLLPALGLHGALHFFARNILNERDRRLSRAPKLAFQKAAGGIIAATSGIQREISRFYGLQSTVISEIGLPPVTRRTPMGRSPSDPLRLVWSGLHLPGKALHFLFPALAQLPKHLDWRLTVIGDGPSSPKWRKLAQTSGIADRCEWVGQVPRTRALQLMHRSHALVITSVYDLTSTVLVEALANGLPVICPDHCGFRDAVPPDCGIKVPASSPRELIAGLRDAIVQLFDEKRRYALAEGALARSAHYRWDVKARMVNEIYWRKLSQARQACKPGLVCC